MSAEQKQNATNIGSIVGAICFFLLAANWVRQCSKSGDLFATDHTVTYRLIGSASSASLTYDNDQGGVSQETVDVPWTRQFTIKSGTHLYLAAQNEGKTGSLTARIEADGKLVTQSTSSGAYAIADAHGFCCEPASNQEPAGPAIAAPASSPTSITNKNLKQIAVGTWTGKGEDGVCLKLVIRSDGTYEEYHPLITNDDWGSAERGTWETFTDKYSDSGKRYFGLNLSEGGFVILKSQQSMRHPNLNIELSRGDSFPFSK